MPEAGSLIGGRYRVLGRIGRGGMSVVYLAVNEKANKMWAVKEIRRDGVMDFDSVRRGLIAETDMLKRLRHPHLPCIVDVIDEEDSFMIVMDYVEGNTLRDIVRELGPRPQPQVIEWAAQLCDLIGYLHTRVPPVIYRDMKPGNIMLRPDGCLVLVDFGAARIFKARNASDTVCLGTIGYAAPEQFPGRGQTDERTDIYGLGATMYYLATGCEPGMPPYDMETARQTCPGFSGGFEAIILRCTKTDPSERYQSAAELMYDLRHHREVDMIYKNRQRKKIRVFSCCSAVSLVFSLGGTALAAAAGLKASGTYESRLRQAAVTADYAGKAAIYKSCLDIPDKASEEEAYLGLISTYRDNDSVFSTQEAQELSSLISLHSAELRRNASVYADICFETGKLYWYYYDYGTGEDKQAVRAVSALGWFSEFLSYAPAGHPDRAMAEVYADTGIFCRDIVTDITEAEDRGKYGPFFNDIRELISSVGCDRDESDIVRLKLFELAENALWQYASGFRGDEVPLEEMERMVDDIMKGAGSVTASVDITRAIRERLLKNEAGVRKMIRTVYKEGEG